MIVSLHTACCLRSVAGTTPNDKSMPRRGGVAVAAVELFGRSERAVETVEAGRGKTVKTTLVEHEARELRTRMPADGSASPVVSPITASACRRPP